MIFRQNREKWLKMPTSFSLVTILLLLYFFIYSIVLVTDYYFFIALSMHFDLSMHITAMCSTGILECAIQLCILLPMFINALILQYFSTPFYFILFLLVLLYF